MGFSTCMNYRELPRGACPSSVGQLPFCCSSVGVRGQWQLPGVPGAGTSWPGRFPLSPSPAHGHRPPVLVHSAASGPARVGGKQQCSPASSLIPPFFFASSPPPRPQLCPLGRDKYFRCCSCTPGWNQVRASPGRAGVTGSPGLPQALPLSATE